LKLEYHELLSTFAFNFNLRRYNEVAVVRAVLEGHPGRAVQVDPIKPTLKAPGI